MSRYEPERPSPSWLTIFSAVFVAVFLGVWLSGLVLFHHFYGPAIERVRDARR